MNNNISLPAIRYGGIDFSSEIQIDIELVNNLNEIESLIIANNEKLDLNSKELSRLTADLDNIDYAVAIGSGLLTGAIDSFFVGRLDFQSWLDSTHEEVNKFIQFAAQKNGYTGERLEGAINFLEDKFPVAQDNIWKGKGFSSTRLHHLDDWAHHPTIFGLLAAVAVQLFKCGIFTDKNGKWHFTPLSSGWKDYAKALSPIIISGVLLWLVNLAQSKVELKYGVEIPKPIKKLVQLIAATPAIIPILNCIINWGGHLISDLGGSKSTAGGGMGLPGIFLSVLKEISCLPILKGTGLPKMVSDIYSKNHIDMRHEIAFAKFLGKQSLPVLINELIVRTFYFVRHLIIEYKSAGDWKAINWQNTVPWGNRSITRMVTIASGSFMAFDMADAAIRGAINSGGSWAKFGAEFVLHLNFVGIGRFAVAAYGDTKMDLQKKRTEKERLLLYETHINLYDAKVAFLQANMWKEVNNMQLSIEQMNNSALYSFQQITSSWEHEKNSLVEIATTLQGSQEGEDLLEEISNLF